MNAKLMKAIICSCESVTKDLENDEDYQYLVKEEKVVLSSTLLKALCTSLTNLLAYKVSKKAHQRYTVKLNVIETLRDWCTINDTLKSYYIFKDEKNTLKFTQNLLEKYLSDDIVDSCESTEDLLPLASALICLAPTNAIYKSRLDKLLLKLCELEPSEESERLLCSVVKNSNIQLSTIETIYSSQKNKLIEQPLLNDFEALCDHLGKDENVDYSKNEKLVKQLFEFATKSSYIFLLICAFLKEFFIHLNHAPAVVNFVKATLERIQKCCEDEKKDILDLYPKNLQATVILLRIEPKYHTANSMKSTLKTLEDILVENKDTVIMLLLHFPEWLKLFAEKLSTSDIIV